MKTLLKSNPMKKLHAFILMFALVIGNISTAAVAKAETAGLAKGVHTKGSARNGQHKVDFVNKNGTKLMNTVTVNNGGQVAKPAEMKYKVKSWKIQGGEQYNFSNQVTKDLTLVAEYDGENSVPGTTNTEGQDTPDPNVWACGLKGTNNITSIGGWGTPEGFMIPYDLNGHDEHGNKIVFDQYLKWDKKNYDTTKILRVYEIDKNGKLEELPFLMENKSANNTPQKKFWDKGGSEIKIYGGYKPKSETTFLLVAPGYKTVRMTIRQSIGLTGAPKLLEYKKGADALTLTSYNVNFENENGGSLSTAQKVVETDKVKDPILDEISYWYIKGDSQKKVYDFTQKVTENLTLVAAKEKKNVKINFEAKSDTTGESLSQDVLKEIKLPESKEVKSGTEHTVEDWTNKLIYDYANQGSWKFAGWTKKGDSNKITKLTVNEDTTLVAHWEFHNDPTVTFKFVADNKDNEGQYYPNDITQNLPKPTTARYGFDYSIKKPNITKFNVKGGSWEFKGWSLENSNEIIETLEKVDKDTLLIGHYRFEPKGKLKVNFEYKSKTYGKTLPDNIKAPASAEAEYYGKYTPTRPNPEQVIVEGGIWVFAGWDPTFEKNITKDVKFTGYWRFEAQNDCNISFKFESDTENKKLPPDVSPLKPENTTVTYGTAYNIPKLDQTEVVVKGGVWKFKGWTVQPFPPSNNNQPMIEKLEQVIGDTTLIGHWEFEGKNAVNVNLKFEDMNGKTLPEKVTKLLTTTTVAVTYADTFNPNKYTPATTSVIVEGGIWHFKEWTPNEKQITVAETFTGNWQFEEKAPVKISFEFISISNGKALPDKVTSSKPVDTEEPFGTTYKAPEIQNKEIVTDDGEVWEFVAWEPDKLELTQDEVKFTGKWKFTGLKYTVQYYNEGNDTPLASAELQTDDSCNVDLTKIDKTKELKDNYKFSKIVYRDNEQKPDATVKLDKDNRVIKVYYKKNTTTLTITKEWHDIDTSKQRIPNEIKVDVLRRVNDNAQAQAESVCTDVIITKDNNWTYTLDVEIQPQDLNNKDYTYIITEHPLPSFVPTYEKNGENGAVAVKDNEGNLSAKVVNISDSSSYVDLTVVKTDEDRNMLSGAVFRVEKGDIDSSVGFVADNSYVREITTGDKGRATFRLMKGIYKLTEEKAPKGYMIDAKDYYVEVADKGNGLAPRLINYDLDDDKKIEFEQADDGSAASYKLSIVNQKIKDNSIYKTDQDGKALSGAKFDLYKQISDDDKYTMFVEVDNSQIGGEQFKVTAQLYEVSDNEEKVGEDETLSDTEQHSGFGELSTQKKYKVKFTFDSRFNATVSYDKDTNTVILHLMSKVKFADVVINNTDNNSNDNAVDNTGADNNAVSPSTTSVISENETSTDNIVSDNSANVSGANTEEVTENVAEVTENGVVNNGTNVQEANKPDNGNASDKKADTQILGNPAASLTTVESEIITLQTAENHQGFVKIRTDIISGDDGEINLGVLEDGEYYLKETQAPTKAGGKYEMPNDVFDFNITAEGTITLPEGSKIKENKSGTVVSYSIVNNWIADPVPEDDKPSDNNTSDPFIPPYIPTEPAVNDDIINDDYTPLSNTDTGYTVEDIEEDDVVIDENYAIVDNDDEDEEDTVEEDDVPLATLPKTGEKQGYGFIVYLATLMCGITLMLAKIAEILKKRS